MRITKSFLTQNKLEQNSDIALLRLEKPVNLTEYVHTICLPSTEWIPENSQCFIHGHHNKVFNHAIETTLKGQCDFSAISGISDDGTGIVDAGSLTSFSLCTEQGTETTECLDNWSGTLVCPDATGKFYAVGVYHSGKSRNT